MDHDGWDTGGSGPSSAAVVENSNSSSVSKGPRSLLDICAKSVAANMPFEKVEQFCSRVPKPVQLRIAFWSFPQNEQDICMYSSFSNQDQVRMPFDEGVRLFCLRGSVENPLQVGFHLSGTVKEPANMILAEPEKAFNVSIRFDRCKITSVKCDCGNKDLYWCQHIVALSLFRIRKPEQVQLRVPISDTLQHMCPEQLLKFSQYLIAEHHSDILPTAQRLADEILQDTSNINQLQGAPDPTAGASVTEESNWHLDEEVVRRQTKMYLAQPAIYSASNRLISMLNKVREMLRVRDTNGGRMLQMVTEECLTTVKDRPWQFREDNFRVLWENLGSLWTCIMLNPDATVDERTQWHSLLNEWSRNISGEIAPPEAPNGGAAENQGQQARVAMEVNQMPARARDVFQQAIQAYSLNWNDPILTRILQTDPVYNESLPAESVLLWNESLAVACCRVDALRSHGYPKESQRLTVTLVRTLKRVINVDMVPGERFPATFLDSMVCLFESLMDISHIKDNQGNNVVQAPMYHEVPVPGSQCESYLSLALEVALMGFMGVSDVNQDQSYSMEKFVKHQNKIVACLQNVRLSQNLLALVSKYTTTLLAMPRGAFQGDDDRPWLILPMFELARYLFNCLYASQPELAIQIGLRGLRFPEGMNDPREDAALVKRDTLQSCQSGLGTALLMAASEHLETLPLVVNAAKQHYRENSQLYQMATGMYNCAKSSDTIRAPMLQAGFDLALEILQKSIRTPMDWIRVNTVKWIITCALEMGPAMAPAHLLQNWEHLFTPVEAITIVAPEIIQNILHGPQAQRFPGQDLEPLRFTGQELETLRNLASSLAIQCVGKDIQNCALGALKVCQNDPGAFETVYDIILKASNRVLNSKQLFNLARHMEQRNYPLRAFNLALLAVESMFINYTQDNHPAVNDVHWVCALAQNLGGTCVGQLMPYLAKSIQCPSILSDIINRFSVVLPSVAPVSGHEVQTVQVYSYDKPPLSVLLEATLAAYYAATHHKLETISPKHYTEFLEFLAKAREMFQLVPDGPCRFAALLDNLRTTYKGKKKLLSLMVQRFGYLR